MAQPFDNVISMPLQAAISTFNLKDFLPDYLIEAHRDKKIYVFEQDVAYEDLLADCFLNGEFCGVLFRKNLTVNNFLHQDEMDFGPLLIVQGDVKAKNIFVSGGDIFFRKNVAVEQTFVAGVYNHGETNVGGDITAEVVFSSDHMFNGSHNIKKGIILGLDNSYTNPDFVVYEMDDVLEKKYLVPDYEDQLHTGNVIKAMQKGKSLLKNTKLLTPIEKRFLKYESSKTKKLDLSGLNLKEIPQKVFELPDLKELDISGNFNLKKVPGEIIKLGQLEKINLQRCDFESFPEILCGLQTLAEIDIGGNKISALPTQLTELPKLIKLGLYNCHFKLFPDLLYQLKNLEDLNIAYQDSQPAFSINQSMPKLKLLDVSANFRTIIDADLPALEILSYRNCNVTKIQPKLWACRKLKKLDLDLNRGLPNLANEITNLQNLQELKLFIHDEFQNLEAISTLPKLKKLHVRFDRDEPPKCAWDIFKAIQWTELFLNDAIYDRDFMTAILKRANLKKLVQASSQGDYEIDIQDYRKQAGLIT